MKALIIRNHTDHMLVLPKILVPEANNLILELIDGKLEAFTDQELVPESYDVISEIVIENEVVAKALKPARDQETLQTHKSYITHLIMRVVNFSN